MQILRLLLSIQIAYYISKFIKIILFRYYFKKSNNKYVVKLKLKIIMFAAYSCALAIKPYMFLNLCHWYFFKNNSLEYGLILSYLVELPEIIVCFKVINLKKVEIANRITSRILRAILT